MPAARRSRWDELRVLVGSMGLPMGHLGAPNDGRAPTGKRRQRRPRFSLAAALPALFARRVAHAFCTGFLWIRHEIAIDLVHRIPTGVLRAFPPSSAPRATQSKTLVFKKSKP